MSYPSSKFPGSNTIPMPPIIITIIITTIIIITAVELSLGGRSPYTTTDKRNKNKYT